jgi:hypothetical protein
MFCHSLVRYIIDFSISVVSPRRERMGELFDEPKKQAQVGGEAAYRS